MPFIPTVCRHDSLLVSVGRVTPKSNKSVTQYSLPKVTWHISACNLSFSQRLPIHSNFLEHVYTGSCIMRCWSRMPSWIFWLKTWCQCSRFRHIGALHLWDTWITPHKQYGSLIFYLYTYFLTFRCLSTDVHWLELFLLTANFFFPLQARIHKSDQ